MNLIDMKKNLLGNVKTFNNKRVFYMSPSDLRNHLSEDDWKKTRHWNGICIYPSSKGPNKAFYFYWGYGGTPEKTIEITING